MLYNDLGITSLLVINLIGVYICYLLVLKQMHIRSRYADKICTLFSKSDCNNVLESDAAKLWGVFGWSEIGMGYFAANIVILLFLPKLIPYLVSINILALPYTVWSVWYQKIRARQWCPLCLIVQVLLWAIFIINLMFGYINLIDFSFHSSFRLVSGAELTMFISQLIIVSCIYAIPVFILTLLLPKLSEGNQVRQLRQEINSIKANDEVFRTLLMQQSFYEVSKSDSHIFFGNPDAKLMITVLTNPFCNPCAKMHSRVENLLKEIDENACIQYIFSAFNESLEYANRYFNAIYIEKGSTAAWQLYSVWFDRGKSLKETFFNDLKLELTNSAIEVDFQKHESWKAKTQLRATPTILINGYKFPDNYKNRRFAVF
jgi:thiol-disulfide isomerase/thioredoxin